jgi:hypothetical protein
VELWKWRSASTLEAAPMWVSPTQYLRKCRGGGCYDRRKCEEKETILREKII